MTATQNYQVLPSPRPTTICINPPKPKRTWVSFAVGNFE